MDNHRLALWCWLQHYNEQEKVDFLHIDQHYDCLQSCHQEWTEALPRCIEDLSLEEYMNYNWTSPFGQSPLFRYDNYLSLFFERYSEKISNVYMSTHRDGDKPNFEYDDFTLLESLGYLNARCNGHNPTKTIVNIDLDYFTETGFEDPFVIVSDEYLRKFFSILRVGIENNAVLCLTLATSPECVGSWDLSESLATKILGYLGVNFSLPV